MAESLDEIDTFSYAAPDDPRLKKFVIRLIERMTGQPYLKWVYEDGQKLAQDQGYPPLPAELLAKVSAKAATLH